jgi:hypothetical protein
MQKVWISLRVVFIFDLELGKMIFVNDIESVNNYPREVNNSNIRYVPPVYTYDLNKHALPYRRIFMGKDRSD